MSVLRALPRGVTLVIKIDYTDYKHPTSTPIEALGTISEYGEWLHPDP